MLWDKLSKRGLARYVADFISPPHQAPHHHSGHVESVEFDNA